MPKINTISKGTWNNRAQIAKWNTLAFVYTVYITGYIESEWVSGTTFYTTYRFTYSQTAPTAGTFTVVFEGNTTQTFTITQGTSEYGQYTLAWPMADDESGHSAWCYGYDASAGYVCNVNASTTVPPTVIAIMGYGANAIIYPTYVVYSWQIGLSYAPSSNTTVNISFEGNAESVPFYAGTTSQSTPSKTYNRLSSDYSTNVGFISAPSGYRIKQGLTNMTVPHL